MYSADQKRSFRIGSGFGLEPHWCYGCDELFFRRGNLILASRVRFEPEFEWEEPQIAFEVEDFIDTGGWSYDVSPDGQRVLVAKRTRKLPRDRIQIVYNWDSLLESVAQR